MTAIRNARLAWISATVGLAAFAAWWAFVAPTPAQSERVVNEPRPHAAGRAPGPVSASHVRAAMARLPIYFVENQGQDDPRVAYSVRGREANVYFTADGVTFSLRDPATAPTESRANRERAVRPVSRTAPSADPAADAPRPRWTVKLEFIGANPASRPRGRDATEAVVSYFTGPRSQWKSGVRTYGAVIYEDLWPGIDMVYDGAAGRLKYTFLVKPGADPSRIRLAYRGAGGVSVTDAGELKIATPAGMLSEAVPYSYQDVDGRRVEIATSYAVAASRASAPAQVGFKLGSYDPSRLLVVDPATFVYVGYLGGSDYDTAYAIAVDDAGNAYVTGTTYSTVPSFPAQVGPDLTMSGSSDAFVAKIRADGTGLVYAGFIGGTSSEAGLGIAVDAAGNAYVAGSTHSSETTFPVTVGPGLVAGGLFDGFVAKLSADGTTLIYSGFVAGARDDTVTAIAVDASGHAYIAGRTTSDPTSFPVTVGPSLTRAGSGDAFVAKVKPDGSGFVYAGYIGGAESDSASGIAIDDAGHAYVVGGTDSDQTTFPTLIGPRLTFGGRDAFNDTPDDAFIAKVRPDGTGLVYAGYIGGAGQDQALDVKVDVQGHAYVAGSTSSSEATFPVTVGPGLVYGGGPADGFVAKIRADGTGFVYAGYIGGADADVASGIAVDAAGNAYVAGWTTSDESTFPVLGGPLLVAQGSADGFVAKVRADGGGLAYAGYIGGAEYDIARGIALDADGNAYVVGQARSPASSFPVLVGPVLVHGGSDDGFVAKISGGGNGADLVTVTLSDPPATALVGSSFSVSVSVQNQGLTDAAASQTRFFLSLDAAKSADDVQLTGARSIVALAPGATGTGTATVTLPDTVIQGRFHVLACADSADVVAESDESNNCRASTARVEIGRPDLAVTAFSHTDGVFQPGGTISLTDTTRNFGPVATDLTTVTRFYLSADAVKSADDRLMTGTHSVGVLAADGSDTATRSVTIPSTTPLGLYFLFACADDTTRVTESDEGNNCAASGTNLVMVARPVTPNLTQAIDSVGVTGPVQPEQSFEVWETTRNDSDAAILTSTTTRYVLSLDAVRSANDVVVRTRNVWVPAPGATSTATLTVTIPRTLASGDYFFLVCADDGGALAETSETDNCAAWPTRLTVARPDLVEQNVTSFPALIRASQSFTVTDTTRNVGIVPAAASTTRYYLSLDVFKSADDRLLAGVTDRPALPAGGMTGGPRTVTVPATTPVGLYFVLACADDLQTVPEGIETNNCAASPARIAVVP